MTLIIVIFACAGVYWIGQGLMLILWALFEIVRQFFED